MKEPTVWEYEREDFMTTKPYEELYQFHVQPFVHATQMESLAAYAASKGFRGFKSMYKKYVESLKAQSGTLYIETLPSLPISRWNSTPANGKPMTSGFTRRTVSMMR